MSVLRRVGTRTFASVRKHRNFRLYFWGQAVSFTGYWMQQIAAAWLLLQLTDSAVAVGALALAMLLPTTLLGLFVGTVIDRFDVRRTTIVCEVLSGVLAAAFAVLTLGGWITVWEIYALSVLGGVVAALDGPARHALVFQMVGPKDLPNAVALMSSLGTTARVLGPAIGGFVVAFAGPGVAFGINARSATSSLVGCLLVLDTSRLLRARRDTRGDGARRRRRLAALHRQLAPRARRVRRRVRALDLLVQLQRAAAARRRQDAALRRRGLRPDRRRVRSRSADRLDDQRDRRAARACACC